MTLKSLLEVVSEVQDVELNGHAFDQGIKSSSATLLVALSDKVLGMSVLDVETEDSELKVWVKTVEDNG